MASSKSRQRKLARERYERKLVRLAQKQHRRRRVQAGVGAFLALALLGVGSAWLLGAFESEEAPEAVDLCTWIPQEDPTRIEVGTPPDNPPEEGTRAVTVELDAGSAGTGAVEFEVDVADDPCAAANVEYLAEGGFYNGTQCHELTADGALRCGSPDGTSEGGPAYSFYAENWPYVPPPETEEPPETEDAGEDTAEPAEVLYPAGTVALADVVGANGSQLLFFYEDFAPEQPTWPVLGTVTGGLDLVAAAGEAGAADGEPPGPPAEEVSIVSMTVTDPGTAGSGAPDES